MRWKKLATAALLLAVSAETASYAAGRILQKKWCMYGVPRNPPGRVQTSYAEYLRRRDPEIGWPLPDQLGSELFNAFGARPSPAFPDTTPETSEIALYGDSFTQSPNPDAEAWGNVLAELSRKRVSNYGQGGYGTDQAFLRFRRNTADRSRFVVLAQVAEDIVRNLTRYRDLVTYEMWYAYKPRFIVGARGALELVPIPRLSEEEHRRLIGVDDPRLPLEHESFAPGGPAGATLLRFPFTLAVLENFADYRMQARLARRPPYAEFYAPGHPLHALEITASIFEAFAKEAQARGQVPLALLFPNRSDLERLRASKESWYAPLARELESRKVALLDFGPKAEELFRGRPLDEVYDSTGHFRAETERRLAEVVLAKLSSFPEWSR
jgi:hypothetical protein